MADTPTYEDSTASVDSRVSDLLDRMTLGEKAGQVVGVFSSEVQADPHDSHTLDEVKRLVRDRGIGSATPFATGFSNLNSPVVVPRIANQLQRIAREETRLGIPLLVPVDAIHGHANVKGATVFPHNLGMAATWDRELTRRAARVTAVEMRATGTTMNYSPTADVTRDPRWGRTYETYGESTRLVGELVDAEIEGLQDGQLAGADRSADRPTGSDPAVAATVKHFPAYGDPARGEDAAPTDTSMDALRRVFLPPFERAIDANVAAVMPSYSSIGGEPVHGSRRFLTTLLREDLGFEGPVVSDWHGVAFLHEQHRTASSLRAATVQATRAGVDMASIGGPEYATHLVEAVENGTLSERRLDRSVERILRLKFRLGLFEDPYVDPTRAQTVVGRRDHRELSLACARESVVLAENAADVLPAGNDPDRILLTGPNADSLDGLCGGWTVADLSAEHGTTVREGLAAETGEGTTVTYEPGATITEERDPDAAVTAAAEADLAVVVAGENWYIHEFGPASRTGPNGTFPSRQTLTLPDAQTRLLERIAETGTPTVLVVVAGRPLAIPSAVAAADATLLAFYPGTEGGTAIAEILTGTTNPSGRLPISVPRSTGHLPTVHDHLPHPHPLGKDDHPPSYDPLFAFGHGLSYTDFEYESLSCSADRIGPTDPIDVSITLSNRGDRPGTEVVQVYLRDEVSSRVTPVRELKRFERTAIQPGDRRTVTVTLTPSDLALVRPDGSTTVEPGTFTVTCGGLSTEFEVTE